LKTKNETKAGPKVNGEIPFEVMQVISADGKSIGIFSRKEALKIALEAHLDLVLMSEQGGEGYPIAKVMDFGKAIYAKKKQVADAKKHQKTIQIKEIKIRPKIGEHDYQIKINQAMQFLKEGKFVKVTLMFKGRESLSLQERGSGFFEKIDQSFAEAGLDKVSQDKDTKTSQFWSKIFHLKK